MMFMEKLKKQKQRLQTQNKPSQKQGFHLNPRRPKLIDSILKDGNLQVPNFISIQKLPNYHRELKTSHRSKTNRTQTEESRFTYQESSNQKTNIQPISPTSRVTFSVSISSTNGIIRQLPHMEILQNWKEKSKSKNISRFMKVRGHKMNRVNPQLRIKKTGFEKKCSIVPHLSSPNKTFYPQPVKKQINKACQSSEFDSFDGPCRPWSSNKNEDNHFSF